MPPSLRGALNGWQAVTAGKRAVDVGRWTLDVGRWTLDVGRWTLDVGRWIGSWTLDVTRETTEESGKQRMQPSETLNVQRPTWSPKRFPPAERGRCRPSGPA